MGCRTSQSVEVRDAPSHLPLSDPGPGYTRHARVDRGKDRDLHHRCPGTGRPTLPRVSAGPGVERLRDSVHFPFKFVPPALRDHLLHGPVRRDPLPSVFSVNYRTGVVPEGNVDRGRPPETRSYVHVETLGRTQRERVSGDRPSCTTRTENRGRCVCLVPPRPDRWSVGRSPGVLSLHSSPPCTGCRWVPILW